ncbi:MAG: hypothetical protein FWH03_06385 [Firmicutes bacterium]|nr:hypothetical protein [Bacillota bacterium]
MSSEHLEYYNKAFDEFKKESTMFFKYDSKYDENYPYVFPNKYNLDVLACIWRLGQCYLDDRRAFNNGVKKDVKKSFELCKYAADQGNYRAQCEMGYFYLEGDETGEGFIKKDNSMAKYWFEKSANNPKYNNNFASAKLQLAILNNPKHINMNKNLIPTEKRLFKNITKNKLCEIIKNTILNDKLLKNEYVDGNYAEYRDKKFFGESGTNGYIFRNLVWEIPSIKKDLEVIDFDTENFQLDPYYAAKNTNPLLDLCTIENGLTFFGFLANGDWETEMYFIVYYDGENLRGYVPRYGNAVNLDNMSAFGNDEESDESYLRKNGVDETLPASYLEINYDTIKEELLTVFEPLNKNGGGK